MAENVVNENRMRRPQNREKAKEEVHSVSSNRSAIINRSKILVFYFVRIISIVYIIRTNHIINRGLPISCCTV